LHRTEAKRHSKKKKRGALWEKMKQGKKRLETPPRKKRRGPSVHTTNTVGKESLLVKVKGVSGKKGVAGVDVSVKKKCMTEHGFDGQGGLTKENENAGVFQGGKKSPNRQKKKKPNVPEEGPDTGKKKKDPKRGGSSGAGGNEGPEGFAGVRKKRKGKKGGVLGKRAPPFESAGVMKSEKRTENQRPWRSLQVKEQSATRAQKKIDSKGSGKEPGNREDRREREPVKKKRGKG